VAYPRWLDKKADEYNQTKLVQKMESKRKYLKSLASEVVVLRSQLYGLESELRSFRRDILTLRAQGYVDPEIQDAIAEEMAHLIQLKQDIYQALMSVKQAWSDARSQHPSTWEDDKDDTTLPTIASGTSSSTTMWILDESMTGRISSRNQRGGIATTAATTATTTTNSSNME
jgi:hypothetical protein